MAFRVLFRFSKEGEARFLSHHDLIRLFERALRRAALPVRMTRGFNPHPKFAILSALPVGFEADCDALEVHLDEPVPPDEALRRLGAQLPTGVALRSAQAIEPGARLAVVGSAYQIALPEGLEVREADVERLLASDHAVVERANGKRLDIRPAIASLEVKGRVVNLALRHAEGGTPRPSEVLAALSGKPAPPLARVRRTRLDLRIVRKG